MIELSDTEDAAADSRGENVNRPACLLRNFVRGSKVVEAKATLKYGHHRLDRFEVVPANIQWLVAKELAFTGES